MTFFISSRPFTSSRSPDLFFAISPLTPFPRSRYPASVPHWRPRSILCEVFMNLARLRLFLLPALLGGLLLGQGVTGQAAQTTSSTRTYLPLVPNGASLSYPDVYAHGSVGFDYSFPGCSTPVAPTTSSLGTSYSFAVVGVNDGKPFTQNPCLASEFQSAAATVPLVSFYINISAPIGSTAG